MACREYQSLLPASFLYLIALLNLIVLAGMMLFDTLDGAFMSSRSSAS